jgi:hypothetical protein
LYFYHRPQQEYGTPVFTSLRLSLKYTQHDLSLLYFCAKGRKRKLHKLKATQALWNSYYRYTIDYTADKIKQSHLPTAEYYP